MSTPIAIEEPSIRHDRIRLTWSAALLRVVLFIAVPLLLEFAAYLVDPEIFPAYLPFLTNLRNLSIGFVLIGLFLVALSIPVALVVRTTGLRIERIAPVLFLFLFCTLTLSRLLPGYSGFSLPRILIWIACLFLAAAAYRLIRQKDISLKRLFVANSVYCVIAAWMLSHLFRFPLHNWLAVFLVHVGLFAAMLLVPWKYLMGAAIFLFVISRSHPTSLTRFAPPQKLEPFERVLLIGIDGMSPEVLYSMHSSKKLPALSSIIDEGTSGVLHTLNVPYSPLIWNTIYTGTEPAKHGVISFTSTSFPGASPFLSLWLDRWTNSDWSHRIVALMKDSGMIRVLAPATSRNRLQPALWNMIDQTAGESLVIGGWTTYPPEKIKGTLISDYAFIAKPETTGTHFPPSKEIQTLLSWKPDVKKWPEALQKYIGRDEKVHHLAQQLVPAQPAANRFTFVYYSSIDAFGHHLGTEINRNTTSSERRKELILRGEELYQQVDGYIKYFRSLVTERTLLIICSDHGFRYDKRQHNYPVEGVLLMLGSGVRNVRIEASVNDIAPTVIYALGLPPSKSFRGLPLKQAFEGIIPESASREYHRSRNFYESSADERLDQEKMEELKDLQYINQ